MDIAVDMAFRLHLYKVLACTAGEIDVEIVNGSLLIDSLHRHIVVYLECERITLRDIVTLRVLPSKEMIAEVLRCRESNLSALVEYRTLRTDGLPVSHC